MMKNVVEVRDLVVVRGRRRVLDGLDLELGGGVTGLLGPSGCGKTTLLRALVGVQRVESGHGDGAGGAGRQRAPARPGRLRHPGRQRLRRPHRRREPPASSPRCSGVGPAEVERSLTAVDLAGQHDQVVGRLSGGQRSRVSLAVALLKEPDLLVLDEPTVGLDPVLRRDLWALFHRLAAAGAGVLVSSHVMDEAERCDRLLLMREGAVIADGSPAEIRERTGAADIESAFLSVVSEPADDGS